ncbi:MAG: alpha/beta hydrolase [Oscillospiraceae bacterium]|nr:alpha/beta hydrolase [Oscillospiraceae bacterium]
MEHRISLEPAAIAVADAAANPPLIFQLPPAQGRERLNQAQDSHAYKHPATVTTTLFHAGRWGSVSVHLIRPDNIIGTPNVIFYLHGAGWVFGNLHTHDKLVRELAARTNSVVVFPEYSLSPEAKFPVAIEQCYAVLCALPGLAAGLGLTLDTLTVAGDSVGGNMATVMALMCKHHGGPKIHKQLMFYPVTNAYFDTPSYIQFATDYYLYREGMMWFWDQYTTSEAERNMITASPLRATLEQLRGLPDAMVLTGEADVLRDEGEAYATKLREAGVDVTAARLEAIIHDFVMLNALDQTNACRAAMDLSVAWINRKNQVTHS